MSNSNSLPMTVFVTGDPVESVRTARGAFDLHVRESVGAAWPGEWLVVDVRTQAPPPPSTTAGIIVTGSPASVTERAPWMLRTEQCIRTAVSTGVPILGLCFGHQLLATALGGEVRRNPNGQEMGSVPLEMTADDDALLAVTIDDSRLFVNMTHEDSVVRMPPGARRLARTQMECHAAIRFAPRAWGLQFHPEFDRDILHRYVEHSRETLAGEGVDVETMLAAVRDTPWSTGILRRFAALVWQIRAKVSL